MKKTTASVGPGEAVPSDPRHSRSAALYEQARKVMPGGVSSNYRLGQLPFPLIWKRGNGAYLWDADDNRYIDHALGSGSVILGHAHPEVTSAIRTTLDDGQLFAGQTAAEVALASELCELIPCAEMVRFGLSGSDAVHTAIRLCRVATGRKKLIKFEGHYHGWFDNIAVSVMPPAGPPEAPETVPYSEGLPGGTLTDVVVLPWNDADTLARCFATIGDEIAGVILEPIPCNTIVCLPKPGFLERVRELCTRHRAILVFDEVVTGFRAALGGAQARFGVTPDLAAFGKALGNGIPISCVAGRADLMQLIVERGMMHAGTHNGNPISIAAARATLSVLRRDNGAVYRQMDELGSFLIEGIRAAARDAKVPLHVLGIAPMFQMLLVDGPAPDGLRDGLARVQGEASFGLGGRMQQHGVRLLMMNWVMSASHTRDDAEAALAAVQRVLAEIRAG